MKVDLLASRRHYLSHLIPAWQALDPTERGDVYLAPTFKGAVPVAHVPPATGTVTRPVLIAAFEDAQLIAPGHRPILFEHGIGQSYGGSWSSDVAPGYAGGLGRDRIEAFLHPNELSAARDRARYPGTPVEVVGYQRLPQLQRLPAPVPLSEAPRPVVAFTFHWHAPLCPETASGFGHWWPAVKALHEAGEVEVLGHAHPRLLPDVARIYERAGIEVEPQFERVLTRAHCLAFDNTSAGYEAAAVRCPVVVLDNLDYRRDVEHGLRFWSHADIGPRISEPADLPAAIERALSGPWPGADDLLADVFPAVEDPPATAARAIRSVANRPRSATVPV